VSKSTQAQARTTKGNLAKLYEDVLNQAKEASDEISEELVTLLEKKIELLRGE